MRTLFMLIFSFSVLSYAQAQTFHTVNSGNFYYTPSSITINVGDTIQWINDGGLHNVNTAINSITGANFNNPESFVSSPTDDDILFTKVFTIEGTYEYDCSVGSHAANGMVGIVIVNPATNTSQPEKVNTLNSFQTFYLPESNNLQVEFNLSKAADNTIINMYSFSGQVVLNQRINAVSGDNSHLIDINSNIPSGVYFVSLQVNDRIETKKIFIR